MTTNAGRLLAGLLLLAAATADARPMDLLAHAAVMESLRQVEPWFRPRWLAENGLQDWFRSRSHKPESTGIRCIGRWSYGPSVKVSLRATSDDTIICLARGSGASLIRFRSRDSLSLDLLSDIDCNGVVSRAIIRDSLVFCGMREGGTGIEAWGVHDLAVPTRLSYVFLPSIMDIAVQDTFLYAIGYVQDSLRIFSVADPHNPRQVGACSDSGFSMCVADGYAYLADQYGVNIVDVRNPATPTRVGRLGGFEALSVAVRDTLCWVGTYTGSFSLRVYNVSNPVTPVPVGSLAGVEAPDIYLPPTCDTILYTPKLDVVNIANPAGPRLVGQVACPGWDYGVTAVPSLSYALVADHWQGLVAVDIRQPTAPAVAAIRFTADMAEDIEVRSGRAYVASYHAGMRILDVTDPTRPVEMGGYDSLGYTLPTHSVTADDSFAYMGWIWPTRLLTVDVSDPYHPTRGGGCTISNYPTDMALRDTWVYVAMLGALQVVNVARPREPRLVGSCVTQEDATGLCLVDTLAYMASYPATIINVRNPATPTVVGTIQRGVWNLSVRDTFAFVSSGGVVVYSVADPTQPRVLDSISLGPNTYWVEAVGTRLYTGNRDGIHVVDATDVHNMRAVGFAATPYSVTRLHYSSPYVYAACWDAGVCVFESTQTGVSEERRGGEVGRTMRAWPSVTRGRVSIGGTVGPWRLLDVTGKVVAEGDATGADIDLSWLAPGVYIMRVQGSGVGDQGSSQKVVITR